MPTTKPKFLLLKNLLAVATASVSSNMFRKLYYQVGNRRIEVLRDGDLSCAVEKILWHKKLES